MDRTSPLPILTVGPTPAGAKEALAREGGELAAANDAAVEWAVHSLSQSTPNFRFAQVYRSWLAPHVKENTRLEEVYRNSVTKLAPARGQSVQIPSVDFSKVDEW